VNLTWDDVVDVLTLCAAYDRRTVGEFDIQAWLDALHVAGVTSKADAMRAVTMHHAKSSDWCKPSHVAAIVRRIRQERLDHVDGIVPVTDPDDVSGHLAELRAIRAAVADGRILAPFPEPKAVEGGQDARVRASIPGVFRRPPRVNPAIEGRERPAKAAPARTITKYDAERQEAERARQLAALEAITPRGETGSEVAS
jgi:hypothetical protein